MGRVPRRGSFAEEKLRRREASPDRQETNKIHGNDIPAIVGSTFGDVRLRRRRRDPYARAYGLNRALANPLHRWHSSRELAISFQRRVSARFFSLFLTLSLYVDFLSSTCSRVAPQRGRATPRPGTKLRRENKVRERKLASFWQPARDCGTRRIILERFSRRAALSQFNAFANDTMPRVARPILLYAVLSIRVLSTKR